MPPNTWYVDNLAISCRNLVPGYKNKTPTKPKQQQLKMILEKTQSPDWSRGAVQLGAGGGEMGFKVKSLYSKAALSIASF